MSVREIQLAELDILKIFHHFCETHSLRYSLCAGSLLGAVRHGGFIPWDDDVDVFMPRDDYDRLRKLIPSSDVVLSEHYRFLDGLGGGYSFPHGKLVDIRYGVKCEYTEEQNADYLGMDIFPLDGIPDNRLCADLLYKRVHFLRVLLALTKAREGQGKSRLKAVMKKPLQRHVRQIGTDPLARRIDRLCRKQSVRPSGKIAPVSSTVYGPREYLSGGAFDNLDTIRFEDSKFCAFREYDEYLSRLYGSYMDYPPENSRKKHYLRVYEKSQEEQ